MKKYARMAFVSLLCLAPAGARAGEAAVPKILATKAAKEAQPLTIDKMTLSQLRDYQRFVYVPGGRDPFHFRYPTKDEDAAKTEQAEKKPEGTASVKTLPLEDEQAAKLMRWYYSARTKVIEGSYQDAVGICKEAKAAVDEWKGAPEKGLRTYNRILSLMETARRLENREAIRAEFEALPVLVEGTRLSSKGAAALVNGYERVIEPGMTIAVGPATTLLVESIESDAVVFIYKGQRLRKMVGVGGKGGEKKKANPKAKR